MSLGNQAIWENAVSYYAEDKDSTVVYKHDQLHHFVKIGNEIYLLSNPWDFNENYASTRNGKSVIVEIKNRTVHNHGTPTANEKKDLEGIDILGYAIESGNDLSDEPYSLFFILREDLVALVEEAENADKADTGAESLINYASRADDDLFILFAPSTVLLKSSAAVKREEIERQATAERDLQARNDSQKQEKSAVHYEPIRQMYRR